MGNVERFEDLRVWQVAREVVGVVYKMSSTGAFSKDYALRDQIRRAAETQSQLYLALDQGYMNEDEFGSIYEKLEVLSKQLSSFITAH